MAEVAETAEVPARAEERVQGLGFGVWGLGFKA